MAGALAGAVGRALRGIGVPDAEVDAECAAMAEAVFAQTPIHTRFHGGAPVDVTRQLFGLDKKRRTLPFPLPDAPPAPERRATARPARRPARKPAEPLPMEFALFADLGSAQRCEYLEGAMHVSPSPSPAHQVAALRIARALDDYFAGTDRDAVVLAGPVAVFLGERTVAQPDVMVVRRRQLSDRGVEGAPLGRRIAPGSNPRHA